MNKAYKSHVIAEVRSAMDAVIIAHNRISDYFPNQIQVIYNPDGTKESIASTITMLIKRHRGIEVKLVQSTTANDKDGIIIKAVNTKEEELLCNTTH